MWFRWTELNRMSNDVCVLKFINLTMNYQTDVRYDYGELKNNCKIETQEKWE